MDAEFANGFEPVFKSLLQQQASVPAVQGE